MNHDGASTPKKEFSNANSDITSDMRLAMLVAGLMWGMCVKTQGREEGKV